MPYQVGVFGPFKSIAAARKKAKAIANAYGRSVDIHKVGAAGHVQGVAASVVPSKRGNPAKSVRLRNFSGTIRVNPDKTVSVVGKGKRGAKKGKR